MIKINYIKTIEDKAKFYAKELWGLDFNLPIEINKRFTSCMGAIEYKSKKEEPQKMILSQMLFDGYYNELSVDDVLLHELCHWYCSTAGKNSRDGSKDFEEELKKVGASSTRTKHAIGVFYIGKCEKCNNIVIRKNTKGKLNKCLNNYISKCCKAFIVYSGVEEIKDTYEVSEKIKELNKKFKEYYYK